MGSLGLPDFGPVQNNVSFNEAIGTTRGIHAEPWDKFVSVASGRVFGAWVDLRNQETFGTVYTAELDPSRAIFVPRGVGNAFQTLEPHTAYTYLVNDHWTADAQYASLNLGDSSVGIEWPIPLANAQLSEKDRTHPLLADIVPILPRKILVLGAGGQLGRALREMYADVSCVEFAERSDIELGSTNLWTARRWREYDTVINAGAFTRVDAAETAAGRSAAWSANALGISHLASVAAKYAITLVQISSDYVFDGTSKQAYSEDDPVAPLGVYGQTKAAGDQIASTVPKHYIVRTSWVIGKGRNFIQTMLSLAERGIDPAVVNDQHGRLTFADEIARAIKYLLDSRQPHGVYNVTGSGAVTSWADIAERVFALAGHDPSRVRGVSSSEYFADTSGPVAPRPRNSVLSLSKIETAGFIPKDVDEQLQKYVELSSAEFASSD